MPAFSKPVSEIMDNITADVVSALRELSAEIEQELRAEHTFINRTGALEASLAADSITSAKHVTMVLSGNTYYASYVEVLKPYIQPKIDELRGSFLNRLAEKLI